MRAPRFHPLALLSIALLGVVLVLPWGMFNLPFIPKAVLAVLALASPFLILVAAHHYLARRSPRRNTVLALTALLIAFGWLFAVVAIAWMQMGLYGAVVFGGALSVIAVVGVLIALLFKGAPLDVR